MSKKHYGKQTGRAVTKTIPTPAGGVQLETFIPWTLIKRGYKKEVITPIDAPEAFRVEADRERAARDSTRVSALMRALGLAHYWQRLLDDQRAASVAEIAESEGIDASHVRRLLRLTLLAPEIIEGLVAKSDMTLEQVLRRPWPKCWSEQMKWFAQRS